MVPCPLATELRTYLMNRALGHLLWMFLAATANAEEAGSITWMTQRGRLLASEDFVAPLASFTGEPVGFASGFSGWRFNHNPKAGQWIQSDGVFTGVELVESHHPATASYGLQFKDAIIQCEVRLDQVAAEGRPYRNVFINVTDQKDHVCQLSVGQGGVFLTPFDNSKINDKTGQRQRGVSAKAFLPVNLDTWHTLTLEIRGEEAVGTLDGHRITLSNPLLGCEKHSVLIGAGTQSSFRHFRVWEALPNPDWPMHRAAILAATQPDVQATFHTETLAELDAAIDQAISDGVILGASLWVERNGAAYHRAYGTRASSPTIEPMTEDTICDLASITKAVATATAAMLCVERGLFQLDDPIAKHLPEFAGEGRDTITIRHLLLHTSGLQVNLNGSQPPLPRTSAEAFAQVCREKPRFEPGSAFAYSSVGSLMLGLVIERVTGQTLDAFCITEIFHPLQMPDTLFRPIGDNLTRVAPSSAPRRGLVDDTVARELGGVSGHASLFSTTGDLARFARMMLHGGELDGVQILQSETIRLMTSVQSPKELRSPDASNLPVRRGLGWDIDTPYRTPPHPYSLARGSLFPIGSYGHTGWTGQMLWIDPASKTFVIFLCNRYVPSGNDTRPAVYQLHHRISTLAAKAVKGFDVRQGGSVSP